jgi:hypothetical protein
MNSPGEYAEWLLLVVGATVTAIALPLDWLMGAAVDLMLLAHLVLGSSAAIFHLQLVCSRRKIWRRRSYGKTNLS